MQSKEFSAGLKRQRSSKIRAKTVVDSALQEQPKEPTTNSSASALVIVSPMPVHEPVPTSRSQIWVQLSSANLLITQSRNLPLPLLFASKMQAKTVSPTGACVPGSGVVASSPLPAQKSKIGRKSHNTDRNLSKMLPKMTDRLRCSRRNDLLAEAQTLELKVKVKANTNRQVHLTKC